MKAAIRPLDLASRSRLGPRAGRRIGSPHASERGASPERVRGAGRAQRRRARREGRPASLSFGTHPGARTWVPTLELSQPVSNGGDATRGLVRAQIRGFRALHALAVVAKLRPEHRPRHPGSRADHDRLTLLVVVDVQAVFEVASQPHAREESAQVALLVPDDDRVVVVSSGRPHDQKLLCPLNASGRPMAGP